MKRFTKLMIAVAIVAMAIPAFSAVENIKVGGDVDIYGVKRMYLKPADGDSQDFFQTTARVYVQAELTDNVEAMVRLINERNWGSKSENPDENLTVYLDLAYIKVCDLGIDGLNLTVGRQEIQFGEGLVVGSRYLPNGGWDGNGYPGDIVAQDLGKMKAFDAIRLDYKGTAPVDVTGFMAKICDDISTSDDDHLYGVNVGFDMGPASLEGYYVRLQKMGDVAKNITTAGIRATGEAAGFGLKGEYAKQFGEWGLNDNEGWALLLGAKYAFTGSGMDANIRANLNLYAADDSGDNGWISYFPSNVEQRVGAINYLLATAMSPEGLRNAQVINVGGGIRPVEKIGLSLDWYNVNLMEKTDWSAGEKGIGNEIDAAVVYDYTEDLQFGLQYGILLLGDALKDGSANLDENPWQLIGSMKVRF